MYGGRAGRDYVTRTQPDNRGIELGIVVGHERGELIVDVHSPLRRSATDSASKRRTPPADRRLASASAAVRTLVRAEARRVRRSKRERPRRSGWRVIRTSEAALLERARASYAVAAARDSCTQAASRRAAVRRRGHAAQGGVRRADGESVTVRSEVTLSPASKRALDATSAARAARTTRRHAVRARRSGRHAGLAPRRCFFR